MTKKDQKQVDALKVLLKAVTPQIKDGVCGEYDVDCGECKLYLLEGLLRWYLDVLQWN